MKSEILRYEFARDRYRQAQDAYVAAQKQLTATEQLLKEALEELNRCSAAARLAELETR